MGTEKGVKLDSGKNRLGLVLGGFANALKEVGLIGTFGANKYTDNGWQEVDNGVERYKDALLRHIFEWLAGEEIDNESGYRHLAHAAWNCLAILSLTFQKKFLQPTIKPLELDEEMEVEKLQLVSEEQPRIVTINTYENIMNNVEELVKQTKNLLK